MKTNRKLKADPGMYAKMRRQRRQKLRWAGSMLDTASQQPGYDERQARREARGLHQDGGTVDSIQGTQSVYKRTRYEQGAHDHQAGMPASASLDRAARDGYNNSSRDRSRLACSVIASRSNSTAKNVYRMRVRLCTRYLNEVGIDYPLTDESHVARVLRVIAGLETKHTLRVAVPEPEPITQGTVPDRLVCPVPWLA